MTSQSVLATLSVSACTGAWLATLARLPVRGLGAWRVAAGTCVNTYLGESKRHCHERALCARHVPAASCASVSSMFI